MFDMGRQVGGCTWSLEGRGRWCYPLGHCLTRPGGGDLGEAQAATGCCFVGREPSHLHVHQRTSISAGYLQSDLSFLSFQMRDFSSGVCSFSLPAVIHVLHIISKLWLLICAKLQGV